MKLEEEEIKKAVSMYLWVTKHINVSITAMSVGEDSWGNVSVIIQDD